MQNPRIESPVQPTDFGRRNAIPNVLVHPLDELDGYKPDHPMDRYLINPADSQPLIESFKQMIPNRPDTGVGSFDVGRSEISGSYYGSRSNTSFAPAHRIRKSSNAHSSHNLGNNSHPYTQSVPPGQRNLSRRPVERRNDRQQQPRNLSSNLQPRPGHRQQSNYHIQNQTLLHPSRPIVTSSLPADSEGLTQSAGPDFPSHITFPPPSNDPSFGSYIGTQFDDMEGSMTSNLPSANYNYTSNSPTPTSSPLGNQWQGYDMTPYTQPNSQAQARYQHYGTQATKHNQGMMRYSNNLQQNTIPSSFSQANAFNNQSQPYVPQQNLPSQNDWDWPDIDLSNTPASLPFPDPAQSTNIGSNNNKLLPPSFSLDQTFGLNSYQTEPHLSFAPQIQVSNTQEMHQPMRSTYMGYNNTSFSPFPNSGTSQQPFAQQLPIRQSNTRNQSESMTDYLNSSDEPSIRGNEF